MLATTGVWALMHPERAGVPARAEGLALAAAARWPAAVPDPVHPSVRLRAHLDHPRPLPGGDSASPAPKIGLLLTLTLVGDTALSLWISTRADRAGRRKMLVAGALLLVAPASCSASPGFTGSCSLAATVGVISPSGNEVGPFLSIEQAALSHVVRDRDRTAVFAWYQLAGSVATALGALVGGRRGRAAAAIRMVAARELPRGDRGLCRPGPGAGRSLPRG